MNEGKRYVAIPQIVIAYDQMNGYLERFAQSHQDDAVLVGQVRLLQNYNILLENHDDMFARLMMLRNTTTVRYALFARMFIWCKHCS